MSETPVVIVGAGPVGLSLAVELGSRGIPCILLERTDGQISTPKMNEVNVRTMEFCRRWGIADNVKHCPFPDDYPMDVFAVTQLGAREMARIVRPSRQDQKPGPFSPENLQVCSQLWFDPILREKAESLDCVSLLYRHSLDRFEQDDSGVTLHVTRLTDDRLIEMRTRYLVGCDGAGSEIRRALDIPLNGKGALSSAIHAYFRKDNLLEEMGVEAGTLFMLIDRNGFWGNLRAISPASGLWRLLFDVPPDFDVESADLDTYLRRAIAREIDVEWVGVSQWTRRGVVAERFSEGRVFLAGDSVHQVSPTGGLGMNTGVGDAVDLGWKLAGVVAGWADPGILDSYSLERQPVCERNVRMTTEFYEGEATFHDHLAHIESATPEGDRTRAEIGPKIVAHISRVFRTMGLQIGYVYKDSPICVADGTPPPADSPDSYAPTTWPGARAPHAVLADGRSTLDLFGDGFALLRLGDGAPGTDALEKAASDRGMPLRVVAIQDPSIATLYERKLVLVRPDGHVAWRGDALPADAAALTARVCGEIRR